MIWLLVAKDVVFIGFVKDFFVFSGPPKNIQLLFQKAHRTHQKQDKRQKTKKYKIQKSLMGKKDER
jgi:hypothetical protein